MLECLLKMEAFFLEFLVVIKYGHLFMKSVTNRSQQVSLMLSYHLIDISTCFKAREHCLGVLEKQILAIILIFKDLVLSFIFSIV